MAMSSKKLFRLAKEYKEHKQAETDAKAEATTLAAKIIPELRARKVKALESEEFGIRINKTEGEFTAYDVDAAKKALGAAMFDKVTKRVIDADALNEQITAGNIKSSQLKKFATATPKAPYITVTFIGGK